MESFRWIALGALIVFTLYTLSCIPRENFFTSLKSVLSLHWGRQFIIDLNLGFFLFSFFIYLNEGSAVTAILWLIPSILFGQIVTLTYFVLNFHDLVQGFTSGLA